MSLHQAVVWIDHQEARIVGAETVDHPTDGQIVAYGKRYFGVPDRVR